MSSYSFKSGHFFTTVIATAAVISGMTQSDGLNFYFEIATNG